LYRWSRFGAVLLATRRADDLKAFDEAFLERFAKAAGETRKGAA
jgi:hypothetical protein